MAVQQLRTNENVPTYVYSLPSDIRKRYLAAPIRFFFPCYELVRFSRVVTSTNQFIRLYVVRFHQPGLLGSSMLLLET